MTETERAELVRILELDYEKTTKLVEGIVCSSFTIRGWGIALISALIGLTFQTQLWQVAVLATIVTVLIALMDGYHSWLYAKTFQHAQRVEHVLGLYYAALSRGDDPDARRDFEVALLSHRFGRFTEISTKFAVKDLRDAQPRMMLLVLYGTFLICCAVSGALVLYSKKHPAAKFECTAISGTATAYFCQPK